MQTMQDAAPYQPAQDAAVFYTKKALSVEDVQEKIDAAIARNRALRAQSQALRHALAAYRLRGLFRNALD